ncbi:MAG TPA: hypothetical protein VL172_07780 [Kofleriaceae bacterium]|nr:hypothetical protein [Kofleriaceae bacterium]
MSGRTMAGEGDKDRSTRLLGKAALPKIEVPRTAAPAVPQFAMPKSVTGPVAKIDPPPPPEPPKPAAPPARPRRTTDGKFKDRTLGWFAIGDQMAEKKAEADDDHREPAPEPERKAPVMAVALGVAALVAALVLWLVLRG